MEQYISDDDLFGLLDELDSQELADEPVDEEMEASNRRYQEIIKKYKVD